MLVRLKPALSRCGRLTLVVSALTVLGLPTFYGAAQSQEVEPAAKTTAVKAKNADSDATSTKQQELQVRSKSASARPPLPPMAHPSVEFLPELSDREKKILAILDEPTEFDFKDESFVTVLAFLSKKHGIPIVLDPGILEDITKEKTAGRYLGEVTLTVSQMSLRSALKLILEPWHLRLTIEEGIVRLIGIYNSDSGLVTRTYPVRDLVGNVDVDYDLLVKGIKAGVNFYGEGTSVAMLPATGCLVIRQSWQGHDEVLKLLRVLRKANSEMQVK